MFIKNDFNNSETLRGEKAEHNDSIYILKSLYKIFLWLPIALATIELIVAIITIASVDTLDDFTKILAIVFSIIGYLLLLGLIVVLMAVTRLMIFHTERIDYNTRMLLELALELYKDKSTSEAKTEQITVSENDKIYNDTIEGLDAMISAKIINDDQFINYILSLKKLGTYNNSESLANEYEKKYANIKLHSENNNKEIYDEIINKIVDLYQNKKINKNQYDDYVSMLKLIATKPEKERLVLYEKLSMILNSI